MRGGDTSDTCKQADTTWPEGWERNRQSVPGSGMERTLPAHANNPFSWVSGSPNVLGATVTSHHRQPCPFWNGPHLFLLLLALRLPPRRPAASEMGGGGERGPGQGLGKWHLWLKDGSCPRPHISGLRKFGLMFLYHNIFFFCVFEVWESQEHKNRHHCIPSS